MLSLLISPNFLTSQSYGISPISVSLNLLSHLNFIVAHLLLRLLLNLPYHPNSFLTDRSRSFPQTVNSDPRLSLHIFKHPEKNILKIWHLLPYYNPDNIQINNKITMDNNISQSNNTVPWYLGIFRLISSGIFAAASPMISRFPENRHQQQYLFF